MLCVHDSLHKDKELGGDNYVQDSCRLAELSLGNSVLFFFFPDTLLKMVYLVSNCLCFLAVKER